MAFNDINKIDEKDLTTPLQLKINSKAPQTEVTAHINDSNRHITTSEKNYWNSLEKKAQDANDLLDSKISKNINTVNTDTTNKINDLLKTKLNISDHNVFVASLHKIAKSGSYNDLIDKPVKMIAEGGDSDTVDGKHAGNLANNVLVLDINAKVPEINLPIATSSTYGITKIKTSGGIGIDSQGALYQSTPYITSQMDNGVYGGYIIWSNGFKEQWGVTSRIYQGSVLCNLLVPYTSGTSYTVMLSTNAMHSSGDKRYGIAWTTPTATNFTIYGWFEERSGDIFWLARGY